MPQNALSSTTSNELAHQLNAALPQTQCQRCGYNGCLPYAQAMAQGVASPNRCPPGGPDGVIKLSRILGRRDGHELALDDSCGSIGPRTIAFIREDLCIGCTKCIDVCPTEAIVGAPKKLHFVITEFCTGCDLCLPPCPVDCITMTAFDGVEKFSWEQWSSSDATRSKSRFEKKQARNHSTPALLPTPIAADAETIKIEVTINSALERAKAKAKQRLSQAQAVKK
jgi:Na+-translocating ferredoxin:NAD+ oxidoreductase subunit B